VVDRVAPRASRADGVQLTGRAKGPRLGRDDRESATLRNGTRVRFRLVRPEDASLILGIFERLSPEARYQRFFSHKSTLSPADLRTLTDCDGENQMAIAAVADVEGREQGLGVARFVRLREDPSAAEAALAVVDAHHRQGLGLRLLARLSEAAAERNIQRLHYLVLADNLPMKALVRRLAPHAAAGRSQVDGGAVATYVVPVPLAG